ncbi:MAG TPA: endopeptidase La [Actinomycetota bacterium]|nr:endopeptidase La [Actinomycetota bacterium]
MSAQEVQVTGPGGPSGGAPDLPTEVAVLPLRDNVLFPNLALPVLVGRERSLRLIEDVVEGDRLLLTVAVRPEADPEADPPAPDQLYEVGTLGRVAELLRLPSGGMQVALQGLARARTVEWLRVDPFPVARVEYVAEPDPDEEAQARMRSVLGVFRRVAELAPSIPPQFAIAAMNVRDPGDLADFLAANMNVDLTDKQRLLSEPRAAARLTILEELLNDELGLLELSTQTQRELSEDVQKLHREQFLRRQLEVIRRELGETDERGSELTDLRERVRDAEMPDEARKAAERELDRLDRMQRGSPEETVSRTYLEWLLETPWRRFSDDDRDITKARQVLDADHYGLGDVKQRVLEYLAVGTLRPDNRSPILCFVGPPGVGKTSLGQSIARALGRQFVRMSLGGVRDEAEIRGHRRTYIGALPGRIIQGLRRAGTANPVMMLDEIDKLGMDFRGDPASALLEVLDPQQNHAFSDHYLEVPVDLSRVLFICTANMLDPIPGPLRDRMEVIELRGYTEPEKLEIARRHLVPRQLAEHGLRRSQAAIALDALRRIVREYTYEAGVRNLERQVAAVLRKVALRIAEGQTGKVTVKAAEIEEMLGPPRVRTEPLRERDEIGVTTGLAWTPVGGDILSIETMLVRGSSAFTLTGQLGDVMKESARAALTYARSRATTLGVDEDWFAEHEVHVHVPAGAIPKDGPSAGIAMATAMVSAIAKVPVKRKVGMTGEITLRGKVLPIGGVKEKVIAAHRAGVKTVVLPAANERDLREVPEDVRTQLRFVLVDHMDQVLHEALASPLRDLRPAPVVSPAGTPELRERASARSR